MCPGADNVIRDYDSPWANGGPHAPPPPPPPPPWSSVSGTILFRGPSGIILAMLPEKKTGTHY